MIDLGSGNDCVCRKYNNTQGQCKDQYTISEQGKSVKLVPKLREQVIAIILDGCLLQDNDTKCDALFLYKRLTDQFSFLVELKGAKDISKAFYQLSFTRNRDEYKDIINKFKQIDNKYVYEKFIIVSNGMLSKTELEKLENQYKVRVRSLLHCEATTPIPDLKDLL